MKKHLFTVAALTLAIMLTTFTGCRKPTAQDTTPAKEGLYLGIVGFNNELYTMPLGLLNQETKRTFMNFVDRLTMQNGTVLYHAVNTGLNSLSTARIPENLINVSIVTFTDGLDQDSLGLPENYVYNSNNDFLTAINSKINNERIGGNSISAYSIGIRGSDVIDIESFRDNLNRLSSDPVHNVVEVSNMNEASEKFAEIAQQLYNQSTFYNVSLKLPVQNPGTTIRFTFDNVSNPDESNCYIQGTYISNNGVKQLTEIQYVGMESMSGYTVSASTEGIFIVFSFQNLTDLSGNQMNTDYVKQWNWIESVGQWQPNSEFTPSGNTEVINEYKSAMIMLVLDCSSSLGNDFVNMKTAANGFIETLSGNYNGQ